jgi:Bacterial Ig domain
MISFLADPRNGSVAGGSCGQCCCQSVTALPGETNQWIINYAQWIGPIGGRGLVSPPVIEIQNITPPPLVSGKRPPINVDYVAATTENTTALANVFAGVINPDAQPLTYARVPLFGPSNGTLSFGSDGTYAYTPVAGFVGYDVFYFETSDSVSLPIRNKVTIAVSPLLGPTLPAPAVAPLVNPIQKAIYVSGAIMKIPVEVSPAAKIGDVYRMQIRATAMDCAGTAYNHVSCFDVSIGRC